MKRMTMASLRRDVWKVLTKELKAINIVETPVDCSAHSLYDDDQIEIWADAYQVRLDYAVVHEILHKVLGKHLESFATYNVYENFVTSLEEPFFKSISNREMRKWHRAIAKKIRRGSRATPQQ